MCAPISFIDCCLDPLHASFLAPMFWYFIFGPWSLGVDLEFLLQAHTVFIGKLLLDGSIWLTLGGFVQFTYFMMNALV